jgi:hypothetical protein
MLSLPWSSLRRSAHDEKWRATICGRERTKSVSLPAIHDMFLLRSFARLWKQSAEWRLVEEIAMGSVGRSEVKRIEFWRHLIRIML